MALEPENFWRGKAGKHKVLDGLDNLFLSAKSVGKKLALFRGGSVVPQFDVVKGLSVRVKRNKAVLLAGNSDCLDGSLSFRAQFGEANVKALLVHFRCLLAGSVVLGNQVHRARTAFDSLLVFIIVENNLHALCSQINASNAFHNILRIVLVHGIH